MCNNISKSPENTKTIHQKCFWCGNAMTPDDEEHRRLYKSRLGEYEDQLGIYKPCHKCIERWDSGVVLIAVTEEPNQPDQPTLPGYDINYYPVRCEVVHYMAFDDLPSRLPWYAIYADSFDEVVKNCNGPFNL